MDAKLTELVVAALVVNNHDKAKEIFSSHDAMVSEDGECHCFELAGGVKVYLLYKKGNVQQAVVQTDFEQVVIKATDKIVKKLAAQYEQKLELEEVLSIPTHASMKRVMFISANPHIDNAFIVGVRYDKETVKVGDITEVDLGLSSCGYGVIAQVA